MSGRGTCKCGRKECTGYYLLHPKEMDKIFKIKKMK